MKTIKLIIIALLITPFVSKAQSISCQELFEVVTETYDSKDEVTCFNSKMLTKATYYELDGMGFVVGYIKGSDYDFTGKPYIFCGISSWQWSSFKMNGMANSWGEAFHEHIRNQLCDCY